MMNHRQRLDALERALQPRDRDVLPQWLSSLTDDEFSALERLHDAGAFSRPDELTPDEQSAYAPLQASYERFQLQGVNHA